MLPITMVIALIAIELFNAFSLKKKGSGEDVAGK